MRASILKAVLVLSALGASATGATAGNSYVLEREGAYVSDPWGGPGSRNERFYEREEHWSDATPARYPARGGWTYDETVSFGGWECWRDTWGMAAEGVPAHRLVNICN